MRFATAPIGLPGRPVQPTSTLLPEPLPEPLGPFPLRRLGSSGGSTPPLSLLGPPLLLSFSAPLRPSPRPFSAPLLLGSLPLLSLGPPLLPLSSRPPFRLYSFPPPSLPENLGPFPLWRLGSSGGSTPPLPLCRPTGSYVLLLSERLTAECASLYSLRFTWFGRHPIPSNELDISCHGCRFPQNTAKSW